MQWITSKRPFSFVIFLEHTHMLPCRVFHCQKAQIVFFLSSFFSILMTLLHSSLSFIMSINVNHWVITHSIWLKWRQNGSEWRNEKKFTQRQSRLLEPVDQVNEIYLSKKMWNKKEMCTRFAAFWQLTDLNEHLTSIVTPYRNHQMRCNRHIHITMVR